MNFVDSMHRPSAPPISQRRILSQAQGMLLRHPGHLMALKRFNSPYQRLIALWVIRAFAPGFGKVAFVSKDGFNDPDLAMFLGFPRQPTPDELKAAPRMLDELKASLEKSPAVLPARARANFSKLAATLKLRPEELQILEFYACKGVTPMLEYTWQVLCLSTPGLDPARFLDQILGISRHGVTKAVSSKGRLIRCGLLKGSGLPSVDGPLRFHSDALAKHLFREAFDPCKLLRSFGVIMPPPAELGVGDFPHLRKTMDVLLPYLKSVRHSRKAGVNILIYGKPGTGKSQLARVMAKETGTPVFELDTADEDGDPLRASARLSALNLAQSYFQDDPVILVFDEAEDILTPSPRDRGMANSHKGWFNQMLGNNRQPVCWISNSIESLDPAFARRFDFILEVPIPPKAQRDRILQDQVGKLVSPALIGQLAGIEELAPAVVTRARDVIHSIRHNIAKCDRDSAFTHVIGGILKAQGHPDPIVAFRQVLATDVYDIAHLNTSSDLRRMADLLKQNPSARLCLHGPPGTGKTAFGHWLAGEIERPIQVERGSDLFSPFVGMTEKNIARTFEKAARDEAVLLIDEVDSFLQDRSRAHHSWEVTQINEMLTQIEAFPGVLIASTNFLDHLDAASLRRFDLKLQFGYLQPDQIRRLLVSWCHRLDLRPPGVEDLAMVENLETATPGDFAAVARQHRFQPFIDARGLMLAVIAESKIKNRRSRQIGFQ